MIFMIMELARSSTFKQAESHLDHLIQKAKFPLLKKGGHIVNTQKTTTKYSQITTCQQLDGMLQFTAFGRSRLV